MMIGLIKEVAEKIKNDYEGMSLVECGDSGLYTLLMDVAKIPKDMKISEFLDEVDEKIRKYE